ncbi:MAG: cache domain-containing protein [Phormidesmis sp.]
MSAAPRTSSPGQKTKPIRRNRRTLRAVLVVPFVIQIFAVVGLTGYFSLRNGQRAVNQVASQLRSEISQRIQDELKDFAQRPHLINEINADAVRRGTLATQSLDGEHYLWQQIQLLNDVTWLYFGSQSEGAFTGVTRTDERTLTAVVNEPEGNFEGQFYALNPQGDRTQLIGTEPGTYDARTRPWYKRAIAVGKATWTDIYPAIGTQQLVLSAALPVYSSSDELLGVVATDFSLDSVSQILKTMDINHSGEAFIMDRSGLLVATSTDEVPYKLDADGNPQRLAAIESKNAAVRQSAQQILDTLWYYSTSDYKQLQLSVEGKNQFVQVSRFSDFRGIDWLVAVIVPEDEFMGEINRNTRTTILLCLASLLLASLVGWLTARQITQPILRLEQMSRAIARRAQTQDAVALDLSQTEIAQPAFSHGIAEVESLAASFIQMSSQLQDSLIALEESNEALEFKVRQRTQALEVAKDQAEIANRAKSQFLANMSDQLRTPLNAILGFSQLLLQSGVHPTDYLSAQQHEHLKTIHRSGERLLALINDLLAVSNIEGLPTAANVLDERDEDLGLSLEALAEALRNMPETWLQSVHSAALSVDGDRLRQLINEISPKYPELKQSLESLVNRFDYDRIIAIIQIDKG